MVARTPKFGVTTGVLAAAVANAGTFDLAYPPGLTQANFNVGLSKGGAILIVNDNDKWTQDAAKIAVSFGVSLITVTNSTGAALAAGSRVALQVNMQDGNDVELISIPVDLAAITGNIDVVTNFRPGFEGNIEDVAFIVDKPVTTAAKLATLTPWVNAAAMTGGVLALTSALATPKGKVIQGSVPTAGNAIKSGDTLSLKATGVTAFVEGSGVVVIRVRQTLSDTY